ncbi:MAG TPA: protein kinase [Vicinamibacterales bacterium]|nr:protein kinase [Vicinamibacterales bacterium]
MIESLGHYKILERIGAGGLGDVYRARDTRAGRTVAIKVVAAAISGDRDRRERLLSDARAAAALSHPNIAALYEIGEDQGELFLVFEFVAGETLKATIAGRPLNPRRAIDLAVQIADAVADAHAEGLVHGGLSPYTIIVTPKGNAKILDLGLAAWTKSALARAQASAAIGVASGGAIDAIAYQSPEQLLGEPIDHRTDVFSLGTVLFEMLTGRLPFSGATASASDLAAQIARAPSPALGQTNAALPAELDATLSKALARKVDQRYESVATMAAELRAAAAILDARSGMSEPERAARPHLAPHRRSFAGIGVLLLMFAALAAVGWWQRETIERAWRHATGPAPRPVIAVLPLALSGSDASQTFFADGLTDDLITRLGQTPGVSVIGRAALRTYRGRRASDVARELGAAVVLTGSVQPEDDKVKLTLALSDPLDGASLWTGEYTRAVRDIFALQARAAEDIAQALHLPLQLTAATARASSRQVDRAAYDLYLRGRQAAVDGQPAGAVKYYQSAIAADDGLPEAFAGLALAQQASAVHAGSDDAGWRERIRTAAERAYQLDPDLASANVAMALVSTSLSQTLQYLSRAIDLDPSNGDTYRDVADVIRTIAPDLSAAFDRRALELDPQAAGGRAAVAEWRPAVAPHQSPADALARDRELAVSVLAGLLNRHP